MVKTTRRIRGTTAGLEASARELRRDPTRAERILWEALKERRLAGLRFRQQHPVGSFVLDFYCASCKLAVEVDGGIHDEQREQDEYRDRHLAAYGYRVVRVRNEDVLSNLADVLAKIAQAAIAAGHETSTSPNRRTRPRPPAR